MDWSESDYSRDTIARLRHSGAKISIACAQDACETCQSHTGKIYALPDVPRLPIQGCKTSRCRCWFVAVDPQSKLSIPELVLRGIQAFKAGQKNQARQILKRAVTLDNMSEQGWFWLSGAVDDDQKIVCLKKVLSINPDNERARAGLKALRDRQHTLGATDLSPREEPVEQPQASHFKNPPAPPPLPPSVIEAREERHIIAEQWGEFLVIAAATDPQMLLMQGNAFLVKMQRLNTQSLQSLPQVYLLDELTLQWKESEILGEALADLLHDPSHREQPNWDQMHQSLRLLAQRLIDHRDALRIQIQNAGGQISK